MCQQQEQQTAESKNSQQISSSNHKSSYSIKRVLQTLFRNKAQQQKRKIQRHQKVQQQCQRLWNSLESLESFENYRNTQMEEQHFYEEIEDNSANEKLAELAYEDVEQDVYVPVRFARTTAGTFFWTTNLQPVLSSFTPIAADEDLLQPSYCYSNTQYPQTQYPYEYNQDRWAQA